MSNRRLLSFLLLPLCASLRAQSTQPDAPAAGSLGAGEREAFARKGEGRYAAARDAFLALLEEKGAGSERAAALASCNAILAHNTGKRAADLGPLRAGLARAEASELARAHPTYRDQVRLLLLELDLDAGDVAAASARSRQLGFVMPWRMIGPFDNERGSGFAQRYGPEGGIDLTASYDGKKRPVTWRALPVVPLPGGKADLGAMQRPSAQIATYVATVLQAEAACDAALHVGCDGAFKVFLGGKEVFARDLRRRFAYDQDAVPIALAAGPNVLMLKLCVQDGDSSFAARLTRPDGGDLAGVAASAEPPAFAAAAAAAPERAKAPPAAAKEPFLGARTVLAATADRDPADAFRLGYLLALRQPDDPNERRDHALALRAAAGLPGFAAARYLLAFTRVRPVEHDAEKEENPRRHDYEKILAEAPNHAESLRSLAEMDLEALGAAEAAERRLQKALAANRDHAQARAALAHCYQAMRLPQLALRELAQVAASSSTYDANKALAQMLERTDDLHGAAAAWEKALARELHPEAAAAAARTLLKVGRRADAEKLLVRAEALWPFERSPYVTKAELLLGEGRLADSLTAWKGWLGICPEDDAALVAVARLQGLLGNREAKIEALRVATVLNPNLKDQRRYLEFLESEVVPFYKPYELGGDALLAADRGAPADAAAANDPYYYVASQRVVRAFRNGTTSEYRHFVVRILTEEGKRQWSSWRVPYYSGEQRARLLDARIVKKDGKVVKPRLRGERVELAGLDVGDAIELRSRVDDLAPSFFGEYFGLEHHFPPYDGVPCQLSELVLVLDPERQYRFQAKNGAPEATAATDAEGRQTRRFTMRDLHRRVREEQMPRTAEIEPLVRVTTFSDWDQFSAWWWNLVKPQIEVSPAMREKVAALTQGKAKDLDKIAAIYGFVTTEINYQAWEFGVHGYKPYSTPAIFERRHGDCKDKALLLCAMLSEIGVEGWPVLIEADEARSTDDLDLALVSHFNHCIAYLPEKGTRPGMFLDGTATWHPIDATPEMDRGAKVLVVRAGKGELRDIPWPDPEKNRDARELVVDLAESGDAKVLLERRPELTRAVEVREALGNETEKRKELIERELGKELGKVSLTDLEVSDLHDLAKPVSVTAKLDVKDFAQRDGNGLVLKPSFRAPVYRDVVQKDKRDQALVLGPPWSQVDVLRYRLPSGWAPVTLPENVELRSRLLGYELKFSFENGELRVERKLAIKEHRIEPAEYPEFKELLQQAEQADRHLIVVKRGARR